MIGIRIKKNIWKIFIIIPIALISDSEKLLTFFIDGYLDISLTDIISGSLFGITNIDGVKTYALVIEKIYFIVIFQMIFGTYIYHDFQVSSVYLFSRIQERQKWFYKRVYEIFIYAIVYTIVFLLTILLSGLLLTKGTIDRELMQMLFTLFIIVTLFLTGSTLIINLITIRSNSSVGFISTFTVLIVCITIVLKYHEANFFKQYPFALLIDPAYGIILNQIGNPVMQIVSVIYYIVLVLLIVWLGMRWFQNVEVGLLNAEING
jgi:hypothetical protein